MALMLHPMTGQPMFANPFMPAPTPMAAPAALPPMVPMPQHAQVMPNPTPVGGGAPDMSGLLAMLQHIRSQFPDRFAALSQNPMAPRGPLPAAPAPVMPQAPVAPQSFPSGLGAFSHWFGNGGPGQHVAAPLNAPAQM